MVHVPSKGTSSAMQALVSVELGAFAMRADQAVNRELIKRIGLKAD